MSKINTVLKLTVELCHKQIIQYILLRIRGQILVHNNSGRNIMDTKFNLTIVYKKLEPERTMGQNNIYKKGSTEHAQKDRGRTERSRDDMYVLSERLELLTLRTLLERLVERIRKEVGIGIIS